ncbi:MAG: zinc ribbon domain-containing protein [Ruminococcus sp.]|nr:zinc ribbon domain-containing protein [Ruminococcus sp.]
MANEKFCGSCGTKMSADAGFCPNCGAKQEVAEAVAASAPIVENTATEAPVETPADGGVTAPGLNPEQIKKYLPFAGIGLAVLAVIIIIVAVISSVTKWTKIDPEELCRVTFEGLDGKGVPVVSFAFDEYTTFYLDEYVLYDGIKESEIIEEALDLSMDDIEEIVEEEGEGMSMKEFDKLLKKEYKGLKTSKYLSLDEDDVAKAFEKAKDEDEALEMKEALLDCISFEIDFDEKKDKLKNGDKIKVTVDYDEKDLKEYNIKLTKDSFEVKVKGLMESEELDIFKDLTVEFEGRDGSGDASISEENCSDFVKNNFNFYISSSSYNLENGDEITVEAYFTGWDYDSDNKGCKDEESNKFYVFEESQKKTYKVEGLTPLEEVDVFEYIDVVYNGIAPDVYISLQWKEETPDYVRNGVYVDADTWNLDIVEGATFVATAEASYSFADNGYKLKETEHTYTIDFSNTEKYASASDVTKDSYKDILDTAAKEKAESYIDSYTWDFDEIEEVKSITSVTRKLTYFNMNKDQTDYWDELNLFVAVYEVKCTHDVDGTIKNGTFYVVAYLEEVTVKNGTLKEFTKDDVEFDVTDIYDEVTEDYLTENDVYTVNAL